MPAQTVIQLRNDTAANWTTANPVLALGEIGVENDTRFQKVGDGTTAWTSLAYMGAALTGTAGGDLTGSYPNPTLGAVGTAGTYRSVTTDSRVVLPLVRTQQLCLVMALRMPCLTLTLLLPV